MLFRSLSHIRLKDTPSDYKRLIEFAKYASPWLYTTHSAHNKAIPTVLIEKKKLSENLADILRKSDGISILAHMLIEKVEEIENGKIIIEGVKTEKIVGEEDNTFTRIDIRKFIEKNKSISNDKDLDI